MFLERFEWRSYWIDTETRNANVGLINGPPPPPRRSTRSTRSEIGGFGDHIPLIMWDDLMMTGGGDEMGWNDEIHESPNTNSLSS